jgi:hypothetical protein
MWLTHKRGPTSMVSSADAPAATPVEDSATTLALGESMSTGPYLTWTGSEGAC